MKIWNGHASEHSANLVMIGRFREVRDVEEAKKLLDKLGVMVRENPEKYEWNMDPKDRRYHAEILELLDQVGFFVSPAELAQFLLDIEVHVSRIEKTITVTTDEDDVSVFLKALIRHEARVEIYSRHSYPDIEETG